MLSFIIGIILSYLLGSVPTAYLLGRMKGIDIREHGSGNVGATNAFRVLGKGPVALALAVDVLKGTAAVVWLADGLGLEQVFARVVLAVAVVCGHNWTVFLNFKGGKGIATSLGVLIGLTLEISVLRPVLGICLLVWSMIFLITGFVSLASVVAATVLPVVMALTGQSFELVLLGVIFCIFVVLRHRTNITRLFYGQEPRANWPIRRKKV